MSSLTRLRVGCTVMTFALGACGASTRATDAVTPQASSADTLRPTTIATLKSVDLDGTVHTLGEASDQIDVVVFLGSECPISQRSIPLLNELAKARAPQHVRVYGVVSNPMATRQEANRFRHDFS